MTGRLTLSLSNLENMPLFGALTLVPKGLQIERRKLELGKR